jgi:ABC-type glycerol-3-phosphate transport system substrate-binding protein
MRNKLQRSRGRCAPWLVLTVMAALLCLQIVAPGVSAAKKSLDVWVNESPKYLAALEQFKAQYEQAHPDVEISFTILTWANIADKTATALVTAAARPTSSFPCRGISAPLPAPACSSPTQLN